MLHKKIETENAPAPGNYSQGRVVDLGNSYVLYTSGQTGNEPRTDKVVLGGIGPQTRQALENIKGIVGEIGGTLDDVVDVIVFMKHMSLNKAPFEEVYQTYFSENLMPTRALVEVSEIPLVSEPTIVEIKAIAYIAKKPHSSGGTGTGY